MNCELTYIEAVPSDSGLLTETAFISKQMWGYSNELMNLWKPDLEISEEYLLRNKVVKVFAENIFIGFFVIKTTANEKLEIDHLWLMPDKTRMGYGKLIFRNILDYLKAEGHQKVALMAEPNAKDFMRKWEVRLLANLKAK
ncbi:MAG: GNAT family N-acetyltransferase [Chitinophagales bacterium]|nr:GNAT family N-acetyltransferase [Chitinophagales bacterium]